MFFLSNFRLWHKKLLCIHLDTFLHKQALYKALTYLYQGRHMRFPENQNLTQIFRNANINKAKIALYRVFCTSRRLRYPPTLGCSSQLTSLFPVSILSAASMHNCLWNCSAKAIKTVSWLSAELFGSLTYFTEQYHLCLCQHNLPKQWENLDLAPSTALLQALVHCPIMCWGKHLYTYTENFIWVKAPHFPLD